MKTIPSHLTVALKVLAKDPHFKPLIKKYGPPELKPYIPKSGGIFEALTRAIVSQQISGKAAASIYARFLTAFPRRRPAPATLLALSEVTLRSCGLSRQKVSYLRDLSQKFVDGTINTKTLSKLSSAEIVAHLVQVKGIGVWTVQMLLIFTLGRLDILPTGDLGVRKGFQVLYGLPQLPTPAQMETLAFPWRAQASLAAWYLWRVADDQKS